MALAEESLLDHALGRFMNHNYAEYHVPVNADIHDIEVIFVPEHDEVVNPLGAKGLGEIGIVGVAAAVANAVWHATGPAGALFADHARQAAVTRTKRGDLGQLTPGWETLYHGRAGIEGTFSPGGARLRPAPPLPRPEENPAPTPRHRRGR